MSLTSFLIAPCGMNCGICRAYLREKNHCAGCRGNAASIFGYCARCIIRNCEHFARSGEKFCFSCPDYPCRRLKQLDQRYRSKYHMSMLDNLAFIRDQGVRKFLSAEKTKWSCACGGLLSCHWRECAGCGREVGPTR